MTTDKLNQPEQLALAKEFLNKRIKAEKRSAILMGVAGALLLALVAGYMTWISGLLTSNLTPEKLQETIVMTIKHETPAVVDQAKKEVLARKDEIMKLLTDRINELIDTLVVEGERSFKDLVAQISMETVSELNKHFVAVLSDNESRLRTALANPNSAHLEEDLVAAFDGDIKKSFNQTNLDEDFKESLSKKHSEAIKKLNEINQKLEALAGNTSPTRRDALTIRFLKLWVGYVNDMGGTSEELVEEDVPETKAIPLNRREQMDKKQ